jgi:hypothetical protein
MSRITGKINLLQLKAVVQSKKAQSGIIECLVIPIEANKLYKSDKGVYLDLIAFEYENKKADSKDTHLVKQFFNKKELEAMTEDEKKALPILGNLQVWTEGGESAPASSPAAIAEDDDLPF